MRHISFLAKSLLLEFEKFSSEEEFPAKLLGLQYTRAIAAGSPIQEEYLDPGSKSRR